MPLQFVLASASPARRRLLQGIGINPLVQPSAFDEDSIALQAPQALVESLARHKAQTVVQQLPQHGLEALVLGCDSVLALGGQIYGKPDTPEIAIARWQQMRGQVGELYTGHALIRVGGQAAPTPLVRSQVTRVHFAMISDRQIRAYVATGEPMQCAGCFALEGKGGALVEKIDGCYSNVIGLSLPLLRQMFTEIGVEITEFWNSPS
jgi:septum formation protein